jgi:deazaflavin-dependent oxidoreductase (nitroreductase family)
MTAVKIGAPGLIGSLRERFMKLLKVLITRVNLWLLIRSKGRLGNSFLGKPVLLLHTVGHKSGQQRMTPLFYLAEGDRIILVASNAGTVKDPAWFGNIKVNPEVSMQIRGQYREMRGHSASEQEFEYYWPRVVEMFPTWGEIQEMSLRKFPIAVFEPR